MLRPAVAEAKQATVALVTGPDAQAVTLDARQALWSSPFGGWVVSAWPFGLRLDEQPILEYQSAEAKLLDAAAAGGLAPDAQRLDAMLGDLADGPATPNADDLLIFKLDRPASVALDLPAGTHVLQPFDIVFETDADGLPTSRDPRLRIEAEPRRISVVCHPVTFRTVADGRSVAGPLVLTLGGRSLLGGLENLLAEASRRGKAAGTAPPAQMFLRMTVYLPASANDRPYEVNGTPFHVGGDGRVTLAAGTETPIRCVDGREIHLPAEPARQVAAAPRTVGVRWHRTADGVNVSVGEAALVRPEAGGSGRVVRSDAGPLTLRVGSFTGKLPAADPAWPHALLVWDGESRSCWLAEVPALAGAPGRQFRARVTRLAGLDAKLPTELQVVLHAQADGRRGGDLRLAVGPDGILTGVLPASPGLWQLRVVSEGPLHDQTLGLARIDEQPVTATVSLFTVRNRGVFRRGDVIDVLWRVAQPAASAARAWPAVLRGQGLELTIGQLAIPPCASGGAVSGCLQLDTSALAPGAYELVVAAPDTACYPLRFRICQREPRSDFELYSYVFNGASPHGGSPIAAYYGRLPAGPGLAPFLADGDTSWDPAFATYAEAPDGPAAEKFAHPTDEARALMALAGLGMRAVPAYPPMLHHEDWNPKHTLPEELAELRRRLALFVQPRADVAGLGGIALGWYATLRGYWEESPPLDGRQGRRNAEAAKWVETEVVRNLETEPRAELSDEQRQRLASWQGSRAWSSVLPNAWEVYLADARKLLPGLTAHNAIYTSWQGSRDSYAPTAYTTLTHRDAIDYTDYGIAPWGNFRAAAFMAMGNLAGQKMQCEYATHGRHARIVTAFGAAGRGLDGLSLAGAVDPEGEDLSLLRIFERFGSYFSALEPLPDVAVYFNEWPNRASVILHDLARLRRPGMLLAIEDVRVGKLADYKVLVLAGVGPHEPPEVVAAFRDFEAKGGVIIKDGACDAGLPGRPLGFVYDNTHVHNGWGLAYPNGEWEFAHLWKHFKETREKFWVEALAGSPTLPVTTPDADVVISPLAGQESICCFVVNQTLVPLEIEGKWRQHAVLPLVGELRVAPGWHVRDLLAGRPAPVESTPQGSRVAVDFTRAEGAIYLLTKRPPTSMAMQTERTAPGTLRVTAWLADAAGQPLVDPLPFDVTLANADGTVLFRKYAALAPALAIDVPVPVASLERPLRLEVRDLVLGCLAVQDVTPATGAVLARQNADFVGGSAAVAEFVVGRKGPVTVLLDEGQEALRPAAERVAELLKKGGRDARVIRWDPADVRPLPLRWKPLAEDQAITASLSDGTSFAWRVGLGAVEKRDTKDTRSVQFDDPACGYDEYGPRLRTDADVVLLGTPATHRALADLQPYLRRVPSESYPAPGGFFVHYLWSPFQGGYDGLYLGCHDAAGAAAAVDALGALFTIDKAGPAQAAALDAAPVVTPGGAATPVENMVAGKFGAPILDVAFAPDGARLFVTTDSYGDSLFALSPAGEIQAKHALGNRCGNSLWWRAGGRLRALDATTIQVSMGSADYRYSLEEGWLSQAVSPPTGFNGRFTVPVAASTVLDDAAHARAFLGGARKLQALDNQGRLLWTYDDAVLRTRTDDLLYPRSLFPRAVTPDGRVLLVAGFGIKHDCYARGAAVNASVLGLDAANGKLLWQRDALLLNTGKAIALDQRFLVVDDSGVAQVIRAPDGQEASRLRPVAGSDWILPMPGRDELLVVENNAFDRQGPTARVFFRPLGEGASDRILAVTGRVTDAAVAADGQSVTFATSRGTTLRFAPDGRLLWCAETPSGGIVRLAPDGQTVLVGARDGVLHWLQAADGRPVRAVDLNPFNVTTPARFVSQHGSIGQVPADADRTAPPEPPEPSYLATLDPQKVSFGPNLLPAERLRAKLQAATVAAGDPATFAYLGSLAPDTTFTIQVEAGQTYLVELLAGAAAPARLTAQTRLEVTVTGVRKSANLPYVGRLPTSRFLARRRLAFRADEAGEVTLTLRAVRPRLVGEGKQAHLTYAPADADDAGLLVADVVVTSMAFGGRNVIFDGGAAAGSRPAGALTCQVKPWTGGNSTIRHAPYPCPQAALRLVDGVIANQETAWTTEARGEGVEFAEAVVHFKKPQELRAIAVYEDNSGPVAGEQDVKERTALRYGVYVREAVSGQWRQIGQVANNTQLVNVFPCPAVPVDQIRYFWAGRHDTARTDGLVRMAEIEAYSADDLDILDDGDARGGADRLDAFP